MSTFCVFGIKKSDCVARARKMIPSTISLKGGNVTRFTAAQVGEFADILAEHLFLNEEAKLGQIAPAFDAPQFALDWIDVGVKTGQVRRAKITCKKKKVDKKGAEIIRKGVSLMSWQEYEVQP